MPLIDLPADAQLDAPRGRVLDLPPDAQLDPTQIEGPLRAPAYYGSRALKGALSGLGAIGDLQGVMQRGVDTGYEKLLNLFGGESAAGRDYGTGFPEGGSLPERRPATLGSENLAGAGRELGVVDRPDLQPQTPTERYGGAMAEGVGGMLPYAFGGASARLIPDLVRATVQGAASGGAGEVGADLLKNNVTFGDHPELGRVAGNVLGAVGGGSLFNAGNRLAGYATGVQSPTVEAYRRLNIDPVLAGDVTGNPILQGVQAMASKYPGGSGQVLRASERTVGQWGDALESTAGNLGGARTLEDAGRALQRDGQSWLRQWNADSRAAWNNVDMHIPGGTPVGVTNYSNMLSQVRNQMPNAPATANVLQSSETRKLLDALIADTQKGPLTWQDVKGIRTRIGEKLAEPQLVGDTGYTDLKRIYGALSQDLEAAAAARGTRAQQAFSDASALTRDGHGFIEDTLSSIIKGNKIKPEDAAKSMLGTASSGGTTLREIRNRMPDAADELAAYRLRSRGLALDGQQNDAGTALSPSRFLTEQGPRHLAPEARDALFPDPYTRSRIDDLMHVANGIKGTARYVNTSNTAVNQQWASVLRDLFGLVPGYVGGKLTTSPMLTGLLAAQPLTETSRALLNTGAIAPPVIRGLLN